MRFGAAWLALLAAAGAGCKARPVGGRHGSAGVHEDGILDPQSSNFHGALVVARHYDLGFCAGCHGEDFSGGAAQRSCNGCHAGGPTACQTCHGQPPTSGSHLAHAKGGLLGKQIGCGACHPLPSTWDAPGHLLDASGQPKTHATLAIDGTYDGGTCSNVYCHGATFADANARTPAPSWGGPALQCTSCHGMGPAGHAPGACVACHAAVVDANLTIIAPSLHLDGKVTLGQDGTAGCSSCHPSPGGAHAAHTGALHQLAAPIGCGECHKVPSAVGDAGHADGVVQVFPSGGVGARAGALGAQPVYDAAQQQCSGTHCHGDGPALASDAAPGRDTKPSWNGPSLQASCGACHGVPPVNAAHSPTLQLSDCHTCHPNTMDASGAILWSGGATKHLNGVIDAP